MAVLSPIIGRLSRGTALSAGRRRCSPGSLSHRSLSFQSMPISQSRLSTSTTGAVRRSRMATFATARITEDIESAAQELREDGRLVAFPTETVYGLGANAYNETAVRYVFQVGNTRVVPCPFDVLIQGCELSFDTDILHVYT